MTLQKSDSYKNLSEEQKSAIKLFEQGENLFITGSAGTGKSHLLNYLKQNYSHLGLEITASTGIAATNIGGKTIYSFAGIGLANMPIERIIDNILSKKFSPLRRKIRNISALAIDEISMISAEVFTILDEVFKAVRGSEKPMGGLQMLLFGDFLQLPPINQNSSSVNFCFESEAWKNLDLTTVLLKNSFRQIDQKFVDILNNLRFGKIDRETVEILESRVGAVDKNSAIKPTILTTHNLKAEKINEEEMKKIPKTEIAYEAKYLGKDDKIEFLKRNCLAKDLLKLRAGTQVMMIKNSHQKDGIINGSLGVVVEFSPKKLYPIVEFANGKILTISPEEWLVERFDEEKKQVVIDATMVQVPLIPAWAITIHKSQGLTLDKIFCDLGDVFSPGQVYVALSRARSLCGVFIKSINFAKITSNKKAADFYQKLNPDAIS